MIEDRHSNEEKSTSEDRVRQVTEDQQRLVNSRSSTVQSTDNEEPVDDKIRLFTPEGFDLKSRFFQLRLILYVLYTLLVNIRVAKRANRIATISKKILESKESAVDSHGNVVQSVQDYRGNERYFIIEHLINRVENYSGDSLYLFLIAIISFFSYQIVPLERGESYTGHFVSVMLLVSTELVILAIYDLTIRNRELDAIEIRYNTNFAKHTPPARFCGLPVHWFRLLRTVKMQPLSLLLLFIGTLTIISFALD